MTAKLGLFAHFDLCIVLVIMENLGSEAISLVLSLFCYFTVIQAYSICTKTKSLLEKACCYERKNILEQFCFYNFNGVAFCRIKSI